jgi:hypothetical protein
MRKVFLAASLFVRIISFSQDTLPATTHPEDTSSFKRTLDNAQHFIDSMKSDQVSKDIQRGLDNLVRYQNEQRAKQKKQAFLYIGLGLFFLAIFIIGIRRRSKK